MWFYTNITFTNLKVSRRDRRGRTQDALRQKFYRAPAFLAKTADSIEKEIFLAMANAFIQYWFCCVSNTNMPDNRARYIATAIQVILLGAVTYYGVKWLVDVLDPTKKSRLAAQKQVSILQTQTKLQTKNEASFSPHFSNWSHFTKQKNLWLNTCI